MDASGTSFQLRAPSSLASIEAYGEVSALSHVGTDFRSKPALMVRVQRQDPIIKADDVWSLCVVLYESGSPVRC